VVVARLLTLDGFDEVPSRFKTTVSYRGRFGDVKQGKMGIGVAELPSVL